MIPEDKFGNTIYPRLFNKIKSYGDSLVNLGFVESKRKPNLFFKKNEYGIFFADMRGTEEVPIWVESTPLIYFLPEDTLSLWLKNRTIKKIVNEMEVNGIPYRRSFEDYNDWEEDGSCKFCGKDFGNEGYFCSGNCEKEYKRLEYSKKIEHLKKESESTQCLICRRHPEVSGNPETLTIDVEQFIQHHISYDDDKIITVCRGCHAKIHKDKTDIYYTKFKPDMKRADYENKKHAQQNKEILDFISENKPHHVDLVSFISDFYNKESNWAIRKINILVKSGIIFIRDDWRFDIKK